ncbi:MAG: hypothetical protein V4633_08980 [Pseudomonadota bacterium]
MKEIPESEARDLLVPGLVCEGCDDWQSKQVQPGTVFAGGGVVDSHGLGTRLIVDLLFRREQKTRFITYTFTVFRRNPLGRERIYQLAVTRTPKPLKDAHRRSHEHVGDKRYPGSAEWDNWEYDEILDYFCAKTNISFRPRPPHPEHFQLKG